MRLITNGNVSLVSSRDAWGQPLAECVGADVNTNDHAIPIRAARAHRAKLQVSTAGPIKASPLWS